MELKEIQEKLELVKEKWNNKTGVKIEDDIDFRLIKFYEEVWEFTKEYLISQWKCNPKKRKWQEKEFKDLSDEFADMFSMMLFLWNSLNIDIEKALYNKWLKYLEN